MVLIFNFVKFWSQNIAIPLVVVDRLYKLGPIERLGYRGSIFIDGHSPHDARKAKVSRPVKGKYFCLHKFPINSHLAYNQIIDKIESTLHII